MTQMTAAFALKELRAVTDSRWLTTVWLPQHTQVFLAILELLRNIAMSNARSDHTQHSNTDKSMLTRLF